MFTFNFYQFPFQFYKSLNDIVVLQIIEWHCFVLFHPFFNNFVKIYKERKKNKNKNKNKNKTHTHLITVFIPITTLGT